MGVPSARDCRPLSAPPVTGISDMTFGIKCAKIPGIQTGRERPKLLSSLICLSRGFSDTDSVSAAVKVMSPLPVCRVHQPGLVPYQEAWDLQVRLAREVREGRQPNTLLLLEHPHTYTRGRLSRPEHLLLTPEELARRGISDVETDRGGQITYHGPGQVVVYPVVELKGWGGPLKYVRTLEQVIIQSLSDFGITGGLEEGLTGVWVGDRKIAAIGVKISRGVAYHGFAINVNTDLTYFQHIVPCGIADRGVTSMKQELGREVEMDEVRYSVSYRFGREMGFRMVEGDELGVLTEVVQERT
jgi:lipoyl(octanoyl) transferase